MPVNAVSNNSLPFSCKASSLIATSALVVAVTTAALAVIAFYLQWGSPAIGSLATVSGLSLVAAVAITCCKRSPKRLTIEEQDERRFPIPSQNMPDAFPTTATTTQPEITGKTDRSSLCSNQLYDLVIGGKVGAFQQAVDLYDNKPFTLMCMQSQDIMVPCDPPTAGVSASGCTLFDLILELENNEKKLQFLSVVLKKIDKGSIDNLSESDISKILEIPDQETIKLFLSKMSDLTIPKVLTLALDPEKENIPVWVDVAISSWKCTPVQKDFLIDEIIESALTNQEIMNFLHRFNEDIAKIEVTTTLKIDHNIHILHLRKKLTVLHLAIDADKADLVRILLYKCPALINKATQKGVTPFHLALFMGNRDILKALLKKNPDLDVLIKKELLPYAVRSKCRKGATQLTLLMIAACMKHADLYQALLNDGANPTISDNPKDPEAWTAEQYRAEYLPINAID